MKTYKVLFLEASGGGGHISITTSIIQALNKNYPQIEPIRVDVMSPITHKLYQLASRQFVNAFLLLYRATNNNRGEIFASKLNSMINRKRLTEIILETQPDLIFSNYSLATDEVSNILEIIKKPIPFIVFVPDPFTVHNIYYTTRADLTLVASQSAYQLGLQKGIPPERLLITGHPVRKEFITPPKDIREHRKKLGLDPDAFTIFFGGSGHGAEKTLEILLHLGAKPQGRLIKRLINSANLEHKTYYKLFLKLFRKRHKKMPPFQAICVCGDNKQLKSTLEMLKYPSYIKPHIFLNASNMGELIHASDLVVGKAGPNAMLESLLAGKPFIATYHIKGQEDGNIDFIKSAQVGFVEENTLNAAKLIQTILENKKLLDTTKIGISYVYEQNRHAAANIADQVAKFLDLKRTPKGHFPQKEKSVIYPIQFPPTSSNISLRHKPI